MISKFITQELDNLTVDMDTRSAIEHMVLQSLFKYPYFKDLPQLFLCQDINDNYSFINGQSSEKEDALIIGGYILTKEEQQIISKFKNDLVASSTITDLMDSIDEKTVHVLNRMFGNNSSSDSVASKIVSMVYLKNEVEKNKNYTFSYKTYFADFPINFGINKAIDVQKYPPIIIKHLFQSEQPLTQFDIDSTTLKQLAGKENTFLKNIIMKHHSGEGEGEIFTDLSHVFKTPQIRNNSTIGILFDPDLTGYEKTFKIYNNLYFKADKQSLLNALEYKLSYPSLEEVRKPYESIVEQLLNNIEKNYPIINTLRHDNSFTVKDMVSYDQSHAYSQIFKNHVNEYKIYEKNQDLLNGRMNGLFNKIFNTNSYSTLTSFNEDKINIPSKEMVQYHNGIEVKLLINQSKTEYKVDGTFKTNIPNIVVIDTIVQGTNDADINSNLFRQYLDSLGKDNKIAILNIDSNKVTWDITNMLNSLGEHPNLKTTGFNHFEKAVNVLSETLQKTDKIFNSKESTDIFLLSLEKFHEIKEKNIYYADDIAAFFQEKSFEIIDSYSPLIKQNQKNLI